MKKPVFALVLVAGLVVIGAAVGWAQGLSPEARVQLCREKKAGLAKLEAEAPQVRADLVKKEAELENVRQEMDKWDKLSIAVEAGAIPGWLQVAATAVGLNPKAYVNGEHAKHADKAAPLRDQIRSLKQRQSEVGNQIFLIRDSIESLRCGDLSPRPPASPPVDLGTIDRLGRESHDQRYGGQPSPTSGSFGDPTGGPPIVIDPDYRGTGAASTPGPQDQPYRDPYYALPGPFVGPVPVPVPVIPVPPPHKGGKGHGDPPKGCHYKPGTKELHCGKD